MEVILKLGTAKEPGDAVMVKADIRFTTVEGFDRWLDAQKVARKWLAERIAER